MELKTATSEVLFRKSDQLKSVLTKDLAIGGSLYQYVIVSLLAQGGQGRIWLVVHPNFPQDLKVLKQYSFSDQDMETQNPSNIRTRLDRFKYETSIYEWLKRAHVSGLLFPEEVFYDPVRQQGFQRFPYIPSPHDVDLFVRQLSDLELVLAMIGVSRCLSKVHKAGIVHGDIKPKNILWNRELKSCVLADFGCAQFYLPDMWMERNIGTMAFRAPELVFQLCDIPKPNQQKYNKYFGPALHRSVDVWSLGITWLKWMCVFNHTDIFNHFKPLDSNHKYPGNIKTPWHKWMKNHECSKPRLLKPLSVILNNMLDPKPWKRPSMKQIEHRLRVLSKQI